MIVHVRFIAFQQRLAVGWSDSLGALGWFMCGYRSGTSAIWICWTAPELTSAIRSVPSLADDHNAIACGTMRCRLRCAFGGVGCGVSGGILASVPAAAVFASLAG